MHCILDFVQTEFGPNGIGPQHACNFRVCWPCCLPDWVNRVGTIRICKLHGNKWPCIQPVNPSSYWSISQTLNVIQSEVVCVGQAAMTQSGQKGLARLPGLARITGRSPALQYRLVCPASLCCCHISWSNADSLGSMPAPVQLCISWI